MKSIKEKAIEFAKENINSLGFISQEHVDGYVAGANYVIKQIEQLIYEKQVEGYLSLFKLTKLIDNLKKQ